MYVWRCVEESKKNILIENIPILNEHSFYFSFCFDILLKNLDR